MAMELISPPTAHTMVEWFLGFAPESRVRSGSIAAARTVRPTFVRYRNQLSPTPTRGATISTSSWAPFIVTAPTSQVPPMACG